MILVCCGMPRSGSTLQYQLVVAIIEQAGLGGGIGWVEAKSFNEIGKLRSSPEDWIALKIHSHSQVPDIDLGVNSGNAKCLYVYRDVRDVVVSTLNKYSKEYLSISDHFFWLHESNFLDDTLNEYEFWTAFPNTYITKYEDMIVDLESEVFKICHYLNIELSPETIRTIAKEHSLQKQIFRIKNFDFEKQGRRINSEIFHPKTQLHPNHIQSGEVNRWHQELSLWQIAFIEDKAHFWLKKRGYQLFFNSTIRTLILLSHDSIEWVWKFVKRIFIRLYRILPV